MLPRAGSFVTFKRAPDILFASSSGPASRRPGSVGVLIIDETEKWAKIVKFAGVKGRMMRAPFFPATTTARGSPQWATKGCCPCDYVGSTSGG